MADFNDEVGCQAVRTVALVLTIVLLASPCGSAAGTAGPTTIPAPPTSKLSDAASAAADTPPDMTDIVIIGAGIGSLKH